MRFGLVGNNLYGQMFTRGVNALEDCKVVAICPDLDENLDPLANDFSLKKYEDLETMMQTETMDVVLLASVTRHHAQQAISVLKHGFHVVVDRPMAFTVSECEQVVKCSEEAGKLVIVAQVLNFWPEYVKIREMISAGALGTITNVTTSRVAGLINSDWAHRLLNPEWGFGGLEALVHDIDFLNRLWGEPELIKTHGNYSKGNGFSQVHALLNYNGLRAGIESDYGVPYSYPLTMYFRAVGTKGTLQFVFRGALAKQATSSRSITFFQQDSEPQNIEVPIYDAFQSLAAHFVACISSNKTPDWGNMYQAKSNLETLVKIADLLRI